jgi:hypothetical protein
VGNALKDALNLQPLTITEQRKSDATDFDELQLSVFWGNLPIYQVLLRQKKPTVIAKKTSVDILSEEESVVEEIRTDIEIPEDIAADVEKVKIALVVDDVGYDLQKAMQLLELRRPMTISIFPQLKYSRHIAELAHDMGYEVMMHLPMDSGKRLRRNPGFISSEMSNSELAWVLERDFNSIPHVIGVNNHQGSLMTRDPESMSRVMNNLSQRNVFFIDSRTTSESVAYDVAKQYGIKSAQNNLFLDNEKDVEYIKGQMKQLMEEARQEGAAIGICHVHPTTIEALRQMLPVMEQDGIDFVFASEMVE